MDLNCVVGKVLVNNARVPPRKGRVDLNISSTTSLILSVVPPRKGRVDLNHCGRGALKMPERVPPRKGRVDLNIQKTDISEYLKSPAPQGAGGFKCDAHA